MRLPDHPDVVAVTDRSLLVHPVPAAQLVYCNFFSASALLNSFLSESFQTKDHAVAFDDGGRFHGKSEE